MLTSNVGGYQICSLGNYYIMVPAFYGAFEIAKCF